MTDINSDTLTDIEKIKDNDHDSRSKFVFQYKYFIAQLLSDLFPKIFGDMSLERIVEECLCDPKIPESPYVTLLSADIRQAGAPKCLEDLIISVDFPAKYQKEGERFKQSFILNLEPQYYEPTNYPLENRIKIYNSDLTQKQPQYYGFKDYLDYYKYCRAVCSVWIISRSNKEEPFTTIYGNDSRKIDDHQEVTFEDFPLENNFKIYLGDQDDIRNIDLYRFINTLIELDVDSILNLAQELGIPLTKKETKEMNFYENAILVNRREGRKEGERKGLIEGERKGLIKGEQKEINRALSFLKELCKDERYSQEKTDVILKNFRSYKNDRSKNNEERDEFL